jgi:HPt (histidine-containing phosphotransfer) domain-containing protein
MSDAFDEDALVDRVDGDLEFLQETNAMLDEDSPALLEEIHAAIRSRDAAALVKPAHALKGMLANFCAEPAEAAARELEIMGREERLAKVAAAADRVQRETEQLRAALHQFLKAKTE